MQRASKDATDCVGFLVEDATMFVACRLGVRMAVMLRRVSSNVCTANHMCSVIFGTGSKVASTFSIHVDGILSNAVRVCLMLAMCKSMSYAGNV